MSVKLRSVASNLHLLAILVTCAIFSSSATHAEEAPKIEQSIEQRLAILERKYEIAQEEAATKVAATVTVNDGFKVNSSDGNFVLKLAGYVQTDYRDYLSDADQFTDSFLLRRVRLLIEGTINKVLDFRIQPDFANGGGTANASGAVTGSLLQDAYVEIKEFPGFKFRVGKFRGPFSLERLQSGAALNFVERGFPSSLAPNYETGVQFSGDFGPGVFSYQVGAFNGGTDGASEETDLNDHKDYVARIFLHPFKNVVGILQGVGVGVAASLGDQKGTAAVSQLPSYRTNGQQAFFNYLSGDTFAFGRRNRISPQGYWYAANKSLFGEYTISAQEVRRATTTTTTDSIANRGWVVAGTWVLTGEKTSFCGVTPHKNFNPKNGGWGALELAARYSELRVDNAAFPRYASINASARRAKAWTGGFNWYLNKSVKVTSNYEYTKFDGGAGVSANDVQNRRPERAILSRVQLVY